MQHTQYEYFVQSLLPDNIQLENKKFLLTDEVLQKLQAKYGMHCCYLASHLDTKAVASVKRVIMRCFNKPPVIFVSCHDKSDDAVTLHYSDPIICNSCFGNKRRRYANIKRAIRTGARFLGNSAFYTHNGYLPPAPLTYHYGLSPYDYHMYYPKFYPHVRTPGKRFHNSHHRRRRRFENGAHKHDGKHGRRK